MSSISYIVVHGGAGAHGSRYETEVKRALRTACSRALTSVTSIESSTSESVSSASRTLTMVEDSICVLENDDHLNAGYGSNLAIDGTVECDASIISYQDRQRFALFGSVGAVSGIRNPIKLAKSILDFSCKPDKLGRVPPSTLVSSGARKFAQGRVETVSEDALIAPVAYAQWEKWKHRLEVASLDEISTGSPSMQSDTSIGGVDEHDLYDHSAMQDTVGAIAFDTADASMSAGVSSGGLLLKHPGRIGEAAVFGAGCWANRNMACSVSGTGEHIVRADIARKIGEALDPKQHRASEDRDEDEDQNGEADPHDVLTRVLADFWESPAVGVIMLTAERRAEDKKYPAVRLWCAFTTASMAVGYASTTNPKPKTTIFRHPDSQHHDDRNSDKPQIFITSIPL